MPIPVSTYRLQFHAGFTFADATAIIPYLKALGVTHIYASPYLKAKSGSTHGYDVIDHCSLNPEIGSPSEFESFVAALESNGLSHILDIVPNHAGVATNQNTWWNDVLENGPASRYAKYFDIAWKSSSRENAQGKLLLPVLGEPYGTALDAGQLQLKLESGGLFVQYYDRRFPIAPETYFDILSREITDQLPFGNIKASLAELTTSNPAVNLTIESNLARLNGTPGNPASFDSLDGLLNRQHYRLAFWRTASDEINYRRFFDINDLAGLAMDRQEVFESTHKFVLRLVHDGKLAGLRVDHPDGLFDPRQYFRRLQSASPDLYVVVEKILAFNEPLRWDWPVSGTTGYDFLALANGLFVDRSAEADFSRIYQEFTGDNTSYADLVYRNKRMVLERSFSSELHMLARHLDAIASRDRHARDFTLNRLRSALATLISSFPVYRSYVAHDVIHPEDESLVNRAIERATVRDPETSAQLFAFIGDMILQRPRREFSERDRAAQLRFAGKFQQLTAPVTAKGIEDTTFYVYNRLISLNEVGGDPDHFGTSPESLHAYLQDRQQNWPGGLSPLSTHDTKRSEDVRARINVLSEIPDQWEQAVNRWRKLNGDIRGDVHPNDEYLLYQTLIGAWPLDDSDFAQFLPRIQAYLQKALREGKARTSWTTPNEKYEKAVSEFAARILDPQLSRAFLDDFCRLQQIVSIYGFYNSLSQTLLRLTAPGVPDTYQGTELWDLSLVDPDNRRPVDYAKRSTMLATLMADMAEAGSNRAAMIKDLLNSKEDSRIKLYTTTVGLNCRRANPDLFSAGDYQPLTLTGPKRDHVFAFARHYEDQEAIAIIPRLYAKLLGNPARIPIGPEIWADTSVVLPDASGNHSMNNVYSGQTMNPRQQNHKCAIPLAEALEHFPVALLISSSAT